MKLYKIIGVTILFCGCYFFEDDTHVLAQLEQKYDTVFVNKFKATLEEKVVDEYFDLIHSDIIDLLEKDHKSKMLFEKYRILNDNERSHIVLYYWHQKLNSEPYLLEEHLKMIYERNTLTEEKVKEIEKIAKTNFSKFDIGDTLLVKYSVSILENGHRHAFKYSDSTVFWEFNIDKDLAIKGIIINKEFFKDGKIDDYNFDLKVIDLNRFDTYFFMKRIEKGDTIDIDLAIHPLTLFEE